MLAVCVRPENKSFHGVCCAPRSNPLLTFPNDKRKIRKPTFVPFDGSEHCFVAVFLPGLSWLNWLTVQFCISRLFVVWLFLVFISLTDRRACVCVCVCVCVCIQQTSFFPVGCFFVFPQGEASGETAEYVVVGHCCESGDLLTPIAGAASEIARRSLDKAEIGERGEGRTDRQTERKRWRSVWSSGNVCALRFSFFVDRAKCRGVVCCWVAKHVSTVV